MAENSFLAVAYFKIHFTSKHRLIHLYLKFSVVICVEFSRNTKQRFLMLPSNSFKSHWVLNVSNGDFNYSHEIPHSLFENIGTPFHFSQLADKITSTSEDVYNRFVSQVYSHADTIDPIQISIYVDNEIRYIHIGASKLLMNASNTNIVVGSIEDITYKFKEDRLNHEKLVHYNEFLTEGFCVSDNLTIVDSNDVFNKIIGYEHDEVIGMNILKIADETYKELLTQNIAENFKQPYHIKSIRKNGEEIDLELHGHMIKLGGKSLRFTSVRDITSRLETENLGKSMSRLVELSKNKEITSGNIMKAIREILLATCNLINVSRASTWVYDKKEGTLSLIMLYLKKEKEYLGSKMVLREADSPQYFAALVKETPIIASDVLIHPDTKAFTHTYLAPNNIKSLLNIPIFIDGKLNGVLCLEQVDIIKKWSQADILYARSIADIITVAYKSYLRKKSEDKVLRRNKELVKQKYIIEQQKKGIVDSINYAKRIQNSLLKNKNELQEILPDSFIIYEPKDIISGDFYWFAEMHGKKYIATADCTGHGVPGAMMSMLCCSLLTKIIEQDHSGNPAMILFKLNNLLIKSLNKKHNDVNDGMEIGLCIINPGLEQMQFASAGRILLKVTDGEVVDYKGERVSIGDYSNKEFTNYYISLSDKLSTFYMFTDGYQDQFGGKLNKKLLLKNLKVILSSASGLALSDQESFISRHFAEWKGHEEQVDDVLMMGFRV